MLTSKALLSARRSASGLRPCDDQKRARQKKAKTRTVRAENKLVKEAEARTSLAA